MRPSPALVISIVALSVAIGGSAYAALKLPKNSVGTKQIKANAVTSAKVKNRSLVAKDFKAGQIPAGPQGVTGAQGVQGIQGIQGVQGNAGAPATRLWVAINGGATPTIAKGSGAATAVDRSIGQGRYLVTWDRDVGACGWLVTPGGSDVGGVPPDAFGSVHQSSTGPSVLFVQMRDHAGVFTDTDFTVAVLC
jgi:hypothetical protein